MTVSIDSDHKKARGNRGAILLVIGAVVIVCIVMMAGPLRNLYAIPLPPLVEIGHESDFPVGMAPRLVTVRIIKIWVVSLDGEIVAYNPVAPDRGPSCNIRWVSSLNHFEDPCSKSKFAMDGTWIEGPATHNMDRYKVTIRDDGMVFVQARCCVTEGAPHR